jgi:choline-sulfatase
MKPKNLLLIISDEHSREGIGCYGNPLVQTPNLDRLAANGVRFANAYTPSPVCVPARASLTTGRWVHQTGSWSSAEPYDGGIPGWAHHLVAEGHTVAAIGKLHFRSRHDPNGFSEEILTLHVEQGIGWVNGLLRKEPRSYDAATREFAEQIGPGESAYTQYDRCVCDAACDWLRRCANQPRQRPWVLIVSFASPHYPLIAPSEFFDYYPTEHVDWPRCYKAEERPRHPVLQELTRFFNYDDHFDQERVRLARAAYYGLCTFVDHNIGRLLNTLEESDLIGKTRILFTSDHGEMLGSHGMWTKMVMYEESAGIPIIMCGPDIPAGTIIDSPVSLVDCYQTIIEGVGATCTAEEAKLPGHSLLRIANGEVPQRTILSEYHNGGAITGFYMIRSDEWKYVYYVGYPPQLFNLADDPYEATDLALDPNYADVLSRCEGELRGILDPDQANVRAFADQERRIEELGGEAVVRAMGDFGFTPIIRIDKRCMDQE